MHERSISHYVQRHAEGSQVHTYHVACHPIPDDYMKVIQITQEIAHHGHTISPNTNAIPCLPLITACHLSKYHCHAMSTSNTSMPWALILCDASSRVPYHHFSQSYVTPHITSSFASVLCHAIQSYAMPQCLDLHVMPCFIHPDPFPCSIAPHPNSC